MESLRAECMRSSVAIFLAQPPEEIPLMNAYILASAAILFVDDGYGMSSIPQSTRYGSAPRL
jgi:hypothetical protein